jgi:PEP-CTERM motif-containing protein
MVRRTLTAWLLCTLLAQAASADPITYRQLRPDAGVAFTRIPVPTVVADATTKRKKEGQQAGQDNQAPRAQESPNHPEFVRLPDGRIVKYGPGVICDENCVEAVPLGRARVSRTWYVLPPLLAAGILCAVLCRGGGEPAAAPPIVIQPSPSPTIAPPTPTPPAEIPEPGTLVLLGLGLGTLLARRRLAKQSAE